MNGMMRMVVGLAIVAAVAIGSRAYMELGAPKADWRIVTDALIALVGITTAVLTYFALRATQVSAVAARDAARAAGESAESVKRIERAYLSFAFDPVEWRDGRSVLTMRHSNLGKTPAVVTAIHTRCVKGSPAFDLAREEFAAQAHPCAIAVGGEAKAFAEDFPVEYDAIYTVVAFARYTDIFGDEREAAMAIRLEAKTLRAMPIGGLDWHRGFADHELSSARA